MLTVIGSVAVIVGLFFAWGDMSSNGTQNAEWAGLMLSLAAIGVVLIGADYYGGRPL